jgi:tetratricopeptide (TPR) repeat protein
LVSVGKMRFWAGDTLAAEQALQRAAACARQCGNHHAEQESRTWLVATLWDLPIPVDVVVGRAERLLEAASGDPWDEAAILKPLSLTYGYAGRFADARAACRRAQAISTEAGAKLDWAQGAQGAGRIELMAGDPAAAEQPLREGYEALRAIGERGDRGSIVTLLAEAVYAQGRFDEALRLTEEGEALAGSGDFDAQGRWRATRAKLLARRGQFRAAARLAEEAVALVPATCEAPERAEFLVAQAEVSRLGGAVDQAEGGLRRALQFYQDRRMVVLAERTRSLLASLTRQTTPH